MQLGPAECAERLNPPPLQGSVLNTLTLIFPHSLLGGFTLPPLPQTARMPQSDAPDHHRDTLEVSLDAHPVRIFDV